MDVFFTSDHHFFHKNVIPYAGRPFSSVEEMNEAMVERWNRVVGPKDDIYYLGDFSFGTIEQTLELLERLNGTKYLVPGNHDKKHRKSNEFYTRFFWVKDLAEIYVQDPEARGGKQKIVLCHYAMRVWNKSHYGSWQLYGHSHGSLADDPNALQLDVGVDVWDFTPVSYEQIKQAMARKIWIPVDHHGRGHQR